MHGCSSRKLAIGFARNQSAQIKANLDKFPYLGMFRMHLTGMVTTLGFLDIRNEVPTDDTKELETILEHGWERDMAVKTTTMKRTVSKSSSANKSFMQFVWDVVDLLSNAVVGGDAITLQELHDCRDRAEKLVMKNTYRRADQHESAFFRHIHFISCALKGMMTR